MQHHRGMTYLLTDWQTSDLMYVQNPDKITAYSTSFLSKVRQTVNYSTSYLHSYMLR